MSHVCLYRLGRRDVYAVVARHLWGRGGTRTSGLGEAAHKPLIVYDFACSLDEFTHNRNPGMASEMRFLHDRCVAWQETLSARGSEGSTSLTVALPLCPLLFYSFHQSNHHRCSESLALPLQQHGGVGINTSVAGTLR